MRCEIQAIDQHWSLHRLAVSLPGGEPDESLARADSALPRPTRPWRGEATWPAPDPTRWEAWLRKALEADLAPELAAVRARQENYLRRELDRIDEYFANYEHELSGPRRAQRQRECKAQDQRNDWPPRKSNTPAAAPTR